MARVPIIRVGDTLIATVQEELHDRDARALQADLSAALERTGARGVLLDLSIVETVDSFLGRLLEPLYTDGASDESVFAKAARELIEDKQVAVLFGCWTSSSRKRVAAVCAEHDRLLFYPAGYEGLENSPNVV